MRVGCVITAHPRCTYASMVINIITAVQIRSLSKARSNDTNATTSWQNESNLTRANKTNATQNSVRSWQNAFMCRPASCHFFPDIKANSSMAGAGGKAFVRIPAGLNTSVLSGQAVDVSCRPGHRARGLPHDNSSCAPQDDSRFTTLCQQGVLNDTRRCVPVVCPAFESADPHLQVPRTPTLYGKTIQLSCRYGYRFNATLNDTSVSSALRSARTYTAACGASCNYNITSAMLPACVLTSCPLPAHSHSISYTSQHNASLSHPSAWAPQHNSSIPRCSPANCSCVTFRSPTQGIIVRPATLSDGQDDGGLNSTSNGSRVEPR